MTWHRIDELLNVAGYIVLGFWVLQFIWYAYVLGYDAKPLSYTKSNEWLQ